MTFPHATVDSDDRSPHLVAFDSILSLHPPPPMTRHLSLLLAFCFIGLSGISSASAQPDDLGIGAALGTTNGTATAAQSPVGLAGKYWVSDRQAVAGVTSFYIGSGLAGPSHWTLQGDYLFHNFNTSTVENGLMPLYVGGGLQYTVLEDQSNQWAFRGPVGITYLTESGTVDVFVEIAPTLTLTDPESLRFDGAIGFRYYFSRGGEESTE